ncbi:meiosis inhibitor protein 1 [Diretmus argenteus]
MSTVDIVYDKIHSRHNPQWTTTIEPTDGGGVLLCVACVIEMMDDDDIGSERKSFALSHISGMLKLFPGALRGLLQQDDRVSQHFIASLLAMLQTAEDGATLEQVVQALVQLLLELQSEQCIHLVLDKIQTQLSVQPSVQRFIPTFNFLGRLVLAVPTLAQSLVVQYVPLLENLCWALLYPDEGLKASVFYIWMRVYEAAGGSVAQSLPVALRDRVCVLLLRTLANAGSPQLIINCLGLLKELVRLGPVVSVLMNTPSDQIMPDAEQNLHTDNSQTLSLNQEQQSLDCPLPLILKKLLRSGEENVMVASAFCMAFILVHSPSQYSAPFIHADVPEFLFERLCCTPGEMLLYPIYNCLLLLTEDPLFFSQCHPVYGIGSVVRSLKEALKLTNLDVPKQGLQLLTEILEKQPPGVRLFPSGPEFVAVSEAVIAGVSSSCLLVATQAAHAATVLLRMNHQSIPVQYKEIERLVEAITTRCSELSLPSSAHRPSTGSLKWATPNSQASKSGGFLLQALACFQAACRLAKQCASEPFLKENAFTAPSKQLQAQDSLESLCRCLLQCCDTVCIPTVTRVCESAPNAKALQYFYSILSSQFTLLPCLMPLFSRKLASSGFYRLALEHKALFCGGNSLSFRNPDLNMSCSGFLLKISMCLLSQSDPSTGSYQQDPEEVEYILQCGLPLLCCRVSDWPSLLGEAPGGLQLAEHNGARATQYCLIIMLHLALEQGDRLLPDEKVFSSAVWLLHSVQVLDCLPPRSVLRSALYLLAVTQEKSPDLDRAELNCIIKVLSSGQRFSSLYIHHPPLLHFIYRYTELAETFGPLVLELWLTQQACPPEPEQTTEQADKQEEGEKRESRTEDQEPHPETMELLTLMQKYPPIILTLLDMVSTRGAPLAQRALGVLRVFLQGRRSCEADLCALLRPALLQVLQRLSGEYSQGPGQEHSAGDTNKRQHVSSPCVVSLCRLPVSSPCVVSLCRLPVSSPCVVSLCRLPVSSPCVVSLCRLHVSSPCVVSLCRLPVSSPCVVSLCRLHVSSPCVVSLCRLPVSSPCVVSMCRLPVSSPCVVSLCRLPVSSPCVVSLCRLPVSSPCVVSLCRLPVSSPCVVSMCRLHVSSPCVVSLCRLPVSSPCVVSMCRLPVSSPCVVSMCRLPVSSPCVVSLCRLHVSSPCVVSMCRLPVSSPCVVSMCRLPVSSPCVVSLCRLPVSSPCVVSLCRLPVSSPCVVSMCRLPVSSPCVVSLCRLHVSSPCVVSLCRLHVSSPCVVSMCRLPVSSPCVVSMCRLHVSSPCVVSLCRLPVSSPCVVSLCRLHVSSPCVVSMCRLHVSSPCVVSMCRLPVSSPCVVSLCRLPVSSPCVVSMCRLHVSSPCVVSLCRLHVSSPCVVSLCRLPVSSPCVVSLCRLHVSSPCVVSMCRLPVSSPFVVSMCRLPVSSPCVVSLCRLPVSYSQVTLSL